MKVSELDGALLDLWVARAEGKCFTMNPEIWGQACINDLGRCTISAKKWNRGHHFEPSKNWAHGGPIIEREKIGLTRPEGLRTWWYANDYWKSSSPLIAAMRAYVASKFGDEVPT